MATDNGNGRSKIGKLEGQMELVLIGLTEIKNILRDNDDKTNECVVGIGTNKTDIKTLKKYMWGIISAIVASAFWIIRGALQ